MVIEEDFSFIVVTVEENHGRCLSK